MKIKNPTVVFPEPRKVVIEDRDLQPLEPDDVLIKTRRTMISTGTELTILSGDFPQDSLWATRWAKYPAVPGYSNVGEIKEVGTDVDKSIVGKRVASCGKHSMYNVVPSNSITLLEDESITDEEAVFFTISAIVMNGVRKSHVSFGESAVVFGMGLLGQFAARFCRLCGAQPVIAVDVAETRLQLVPDDHAIEKVNPKQQDVAKAVESATKGRMADVGFEVTGKPGLIPAEIATLRKQGRFIILSSPNGKTQFDFSDLCSYPAYTIIGTHTLSHPLMETPDNQWTFQRNTELFLDLLSRKQLKLKSLITHREPFEKAPDIFMTLLNDRSQAMGVILEWS